MVNFNHFFNFSKKILFFSKSYYLNIYGWIRAIPLNFLFYVSNKKIISFVIENLGQQQFLIEIYQSLYKNNKFYFLFAFNDHFHKKKILPEFKKLKFVPLYIYIHIKNIDLALHTEIYCRSDNVKDRVFIGHGFPGKHTVWSRNNLLSFNHQFLYGPRDREIMSWIEKQNPGSTSHITLWEIGYPKYDNALKLVSSKKTGGKVCNVESQTRKNILYAPAWDPGNSLSVYKEKIFEHFAECKEYDFTIKLHPAMMVGKKNKNYEFYTGGVDWFRYIQKICDKYSNINLYLGSSITNIFPICDALVSDFSGVALGAFLFNKPVILIDMREYFSSTLTKTGSDSEESFRNPLFNNGRDASYIVSKPTYISSILIELFINKFDPLESERIKFARYLLYNQGNSLDVMKNTILKILNIN